MIWVATWSFWTPKHAQIASALAALGERLERVCSADLRNKSALPVSRNAGAKSSPEATLKPAARRVCRLPAP